MAGIATAADHGFAIATAKSAIKDAKQIHDEQCEKAEDETWDWDNLDNDPFHNSGYDIYRNAIPVDPDIYSAILSSTFEDIPNQLDANGDFIRDGKRQQTKSGNHDWCRTLKEQHTTVLREHGRLAGSKGEKVVTKMRALKSLPTEGYDVTRTDHQPGDQGEHTDEPRDRLDKMRDSDTPLSTIYALESGTRLRIRPFGQEWTVVHLKPGDLLVFRGDVCHHGMGYPRQNVRVHGYVYPKGYQSRSSLHPC